MMALLSLFGGGLGGLLRFVPEILRLINSKSDQAHEFKMTELQLKIDAARSAHAIDLVHAQASAAEAAGQMQVYAEAIKGQGQLTGVKWIDGLSSLVRPAVTYWWMGLFTAYKVTVISDAWINFSTVKDFGQQIWTTNDIAFLSMILGFWFCDRVIKYQK